MDKPATIYIRQGLEEGGWRTKEFEDVEKALGVELDLLMKMVMLEGNKGLRGRILSKSGCSKKNGVFKQI